MWVRRSHSESNAEKGRPAPEQKKGSNMNNPSKQTLKAAGALALAIALTNSLVAAGQGNQGNPGILPPQSHAYGKSYGEWFNEYSKWWFDAPIDTDPFADTTGQHAVLEYSANVWFLATSYFGTSPAERSITIPSGKALLFVPSFTCWADWPPDDPWWYEPFTDEATGVHYRSGEAWCLQQSRASEEITEVSCQIDGRQVQNLENYIVLSPESFYGAFPDEHLMGYAGPYVAVGAGYCLMIAPLPIGTHQVHAFGTCEGWGSFEVTYTIAVTPSPSKR
jgi:hypothetical protein